MDPYSFKTAYAIAIALLEGRGSNFHVTFEFGMDRAFSRFGRDPDDPFLDRNPTTRVECVIDGRVDQVSDERARYELSRVVASLTRDKLEQKDEDVLKAVATIVSLAYSKNFGQNLERLGLKLVEYAGEELKRGGKK